MMYIFYTTGDENYFSPEQGKIFLYKLVEQRLKTGKDTIGQCITDACLLSKTAT